MVEADSYMPPGEKNKTKLKVKKKKEEAAAICNKFTKTSMVPSKAKKI